VPGLPPEQSVDPPAAVNPGDDALSHQLVENMQNLITPHSTILTDGVRPQRVIVRSLVLWEHSPSER